MFFQLIREHRLRANALRGVARPQLIWADVLYFRDTAAFAERLEDAADREALFVKFGAHLLVYRHFDTAEDVVADAGKASHCAAGPAQALEETIEGSNLSLLFVARAGLATVSTAGLCLLALPFGAAAREQARQIYARRAGRCSIACIARACAPGLIAAVYQPAMTAVRLAIFGRNHNLHLAILCVVADDLHPCLFRRSLIEAVGPDREDLATLEDWEMPHGIVRPRPRVMHMPETLMFYRLQPENQLSLNPKKRIFGWANLWEPFQGHIGHDGVNNTVSRFLFHFKRTEVAKLVAQYCRARAASLMHGLAAIYRFAQFWDHRFNWLRIKSSRRFQGHGYLVPFGASRLVSYLLAVPKQLGNDIANGAADVRITEAKATPMTGTQDE